jgi:hypothetical protein
MLNMIIYVSSRHRWISSLKSPETTRETIGRRVVLFVLSLMTGKLMKKQGSHEFEKERAGIRGTEPYKPKLQLPHQYEIIILRYWS